MDGDRRDWLEVFEAVLGSWLVSIVLWCEDADEDDISGDYRVTTHFLYSMFVDDSNGLDHYVRPYALPTFSSQPPSFVGSCWWTTTYKLTMLDPSSIRTKSSDQSRIHRRCTSHIAQRVVISARRISTALSGTTRSLS